MFELDGVKVLKHSSIRIEKDLIIYIDPFQIDLPLHDADLVLCTHSHYDHFSPKAINAVAKESTILITTEDCKQDIEKVHLLKDNIYYTEPYKAYELETVSVTTIPAYNKRKEFHPKNEKWVGYLIEINNIKYYIAGDTDKTKEACDVECDVALLPIGGTYTMDYVEAASLASKIKPKYVIPTHYGSIVGELEDAQKFKDLIDETRTKCEIFF